MSRKLIITADDYGMCDSVNQAIEECLAAGAVQATCVMANMPMFPAAARLRSKFPQSSVGIHWTVTEGRPVLTPSQVPSLVNREGNFHPTSELRKRWLRRQVEVTELRNELRAQYLRFSQIAGEPDFWNTHQNVHVFPGLFKVYVATGQELGIAAMRSHRRFTLPRNQSSTRYNLFHPIYWLKGLGIAWWSGRVESQGMFMPDGILHTPGYGTDQASVEEVASRVPWVSVGKAIEWVIHPATTSQEKLFHRHGERRVLEYKTFREPCLGTRFCRLGIELAGFRVLRNGS
jgi:hypothetical protein